MGDKKQIDLMVLFPDGTEAGKLDKIKVDTGDCQQEDIGIVEDAVNVLDKSSTLKEEIVNTPYGLAVKDTVKVDNRIFMLCHNLKDDRVSTKGLLDQVNSAVPYRVATNKTIKEAVDRFIARIDEGDPKGDYTSKVTMMSK